MKIKLKEHDIQPFIFVWYIHPIWRTKVGRICSIQNLLCTILQKTFVRIYFRSEVANSDIVLQPLEKCGSGYINGAWIMTETF